MAKGDTAQRPAALAQAPGGAASSSVQTPHNGDLVCHEQSGDRDESVAAEVAGGEGWDYTTLDTVMDQLQSDEVHGLRMRVRGVWLDDAHGGGSTWFVDCMVPATIAPPVRTNSRQP